MAFIPFDGCAEVVMRYAVASGNEAVNVYGFRSLTGDFTSGDLLELAQVMQQWEAAYGDLARSNQCSWTGVTVRAIDVEDGPVVEYTSGAPNVGVVASPLMPGNVTLAIKHTTGFSGRSKRGRSYWIGLYEAAVAGDFVDETVATNIVAHMNALRTLTLSAGYEFGILSRFNNGVARTEGQFTAVTLSSIEDRRVDTQRRRLVEP